MIHQPQTWRSRCMPLVVQPGETRSREARDFVKREFEDEYSGEEDLHDTLKLTLPRFQAFKGFWDRMPDDVSEALFWDMLGNQDSECEDEDGNPRVLVRDVERQRSTKGTKRTRRRSKGDGAGGGGDDAPDPRRMRAQEQQQPHARDADAQPERSRPDPPNRGANGGAGGLSTQALRDHAATSHTSFRRGRSGALDDDRHSTTGSVAGASSLKDLLRLKKDLAAQAFQLLTDVSGPKSQYTLLDKKAKTLKDDQLEELEAKTC